MSDVTLTMQHQVKQNPNILADTVDEDLIILNPDNGEYYGAEVTGSRVWHLLETPQSIQSICDTLAGDFPDDDHAAIEADVLDFLQELLKEQLVEVVDA